MQYNDNIKVGKIKKYDGITGEIITDTMIYYFIKNDIIENNDIKVDDVVLFAAKSEDIFPQAYFIKKINGKDY